MENDNNITIVSLDTESKELLLGIQSKQDKLIEQQDKLIEQQQKLVDHFVLSEEEIQEQNKINQELKEKEEQKQLDLFNQRYETLINDLSSLNSESIQELTLKMDNIENKLNDNVEVATFSSGSIYLILFGLVITGMCYYFYKIIRAWFI